MSDKEFEEWIETYLNSFNTDPRNIMCGHCDIHSKAAWQEATRRATEAEKKRCIDELVKWGIENLNPPNQTLLEYFTRKKLDNENQT